MGAPRVGAAEPGRGGGDRVGELEPWNILKGWGQAVDP